MNKKEAIAHESYGMISISRFHSNHSEFFGSDLIHNGGIQIEISKASFKRDLSQEWYHPSNEIIRIQLSSNQYVDAITSGMNTIGVPCTIIHNNGKRINQIDHVVDKKELFTQEQKDTQKEFSKKIDEILSKLDGNVGKRKKDEICHDLKILKSHLASNTKFVLDQFNESMEKTVAEAKHSISNYIDHKVTSLGLEGMREQLKIGIGEEK